MNKFSLTIIALLTALSLSCGGMALTKAYSGAGSKVFINGTIVDKNGNPVKNYPINISSYVDDLKGFTDDMGKVDVRLAIPDKIEAGEFFYRIDIGYSSVVSIDGKKEFGEIIFDPIEGFVKERQVGFVSKDKAKFVNKSMIPSGSSFTKLAIALFLFLLVNYVMIYGSPNKQLYNEGN